ncbi:MAG TPA: ceramidase domain-containing protein, partial [Acidobacteriota bacterium]|nr:ceramidase domain-containing protein [Acidobacteriota bacterium]
ERGGAILEVRTATCGHEMKRTPLGLAALIALPVLAILMVVAMWNPRGDFWGAPEFPKAQCEAYDPDRLHTETRLSEAVYEPEKLLRLFREPQNTVSNLAYAAVGLAILIAARRPAARSLGWAAVFLGFGSGIYHASLLPERRMIDILGVYAVLYCLLLVGLAALRPQLTIAPIAWAEVFAVWVAAIYTGIHRNDVRVWGFKLFDSTYVMVVSVALGSAMALMACRRATDRRAYWRAAATLAVAAPIAFAGGQGDRFGAFLAAPDAFVQGHTIWHTLGAIAILAAYEAFAATGFDRSTLSSD